jgi:hypothetical protein
MQQKIIEFLGRFSVLNIPVHSRLKKEACE